MATKTRRIIEMTSEELSELLALFGGSDSVELKVTLPAEAHRGTIRALGLDPLEAQIRQVFFFDTPDLQLQQAGIAVRARRIQGRSGDSVVKLRPIVPDQLPEDVRHSASMNVEVDVMPGGHVCSASMKGKIQNEDVHAAIHGGRPLRKAFSKEQRAFFKAYAPEGLTLDDLTVLGPVFVLKEVVTPPELGRRIVAELWLLPDGSRIVELSTNCLPGEGFDTAIELRQFLADKGIDTEGEQQTKTKAALEFFSDELRAERS